MNSMSPSMQTFPISLPHELFIRLEQAAHERNMSDEEFIVSFLDRLVTKGNLNSPVRVVSDTRRKDSESVDLTGLKEIIRRQDEEILWLRSEINRLITISPTIHLVHHDYQAWKNTVPDPSIPAGDVSREKTSFPSTPEDKADELLSNQNVDVGELQYSQVLDSSGEQNDLISAESTNQRMQDSEQIGGKTLRGLVGGISGEKNYTVFEAAAIAGESDSVILEYINDGFLPALQYKDTYLIRGNDLRKYILSK